MFRCEKTGQLSESREKPAMVTVEQRRKEYFEWRKDHDLRAHWVKVGEGWEIVKEIRVRTSSLEKQDQQA
jgi:hypothetical protein